MIIDDLISQSREVVILNILSKETEFSFEGDVIEYVVSGKVSHAFKGVLKKGDLINLGADRLEFLKDSNNETIVEEQLLKAGKEFIVFLSDTSGNQNDGTAITTFRLTDRWFGVNDVLPYLQDYIVKKLKSGNDR